MNTPVICFVRSKGARPPEAVRLANRLKKLVVADPSCLDSCRASLLRMAEETEDLRVGWNLLAVVAACRWRGQVRLRVLELGWQSVRAADPFTCVYALELLSRLAEDDSSLWRALEPVLSHFEASGTASMRARARRVRARARAN